MLEEKNIMAVLGEFVKIRDQSNVKVIQIEIMRRVVYSKEMEENPSRFWVPVFAIETGKLLYRAVKFVSSLKKASAGCQLEKRGFSGAVSVKS
jgi:hypothetical protein